MPTIDSCLGCFLDVLSIKSTECEYNPSGVIPGWMDFLLGINKIDFELRNM
jgi:hypothetical protein